MQPLTKLKAIGALFTLLLIVNLLLASFRIYGWDVFWAVLLIIAAISYWGIPWWKKRMVIS